MEILGILLISIIVLLAFLALSLGVFPELCHKNGQACDLSKERLQEIAFWNQLKETHGTSGEFHEVWCKHARRAASTGQDGFTLIELLIVVAIICIIAAIIFPGIGGGDPVVAEQSAREHADRLGWEVLGVSSAGKDTNGDGYIAVTVRIKEPVWDATGDVMGYREADRYLECGGGSRTRSGEGCKAVGGIRYGN